MTGRNRTKALVAAATAGLAVVLAVAGLAWACTPQPIFSVNPVGGTAASQVLIRGEAVAPQGLVEIRWNGISGTKVAQAVADGGGNFSVPATVPNVAPGVYSVVAVAGDAGVARSSFEVLSSAPTGGPANAAASSWSATDPSSLVSPAPDSGGRLGLGMALLGGGMVTLFFGFAVAAARRRRAPARSGR